jgi:DNA-binding MarR family transcriptional regulator
MTQLHRYDCFDIYDDLERAAKSVARQQERCLAPFGLTKAQFNVLREIALDRLPRTYSDIAKELGCDQTTVSDTVKILKRKGFVEATRDQKDQRRGAVKATSEGRKVFKEAVQARKVLDEELSDVIDTDDATALGSACSALHESFGLHPE